MVLSMKRVEVVRDYGGISAADRLAGRRAKLLAAARRIWGESGISEVTIRGVCSAAGLIPRYFYEQFTDRDALLFAVADEVRDQLLDALVAAGLGEPGSIRDKLRSALTAFLDLIAADPDIHRIATCDVSGVPGLAAHRTRVLDMIAELVIQHAPEVLGADTPNLVVLRRNTLFMIGGANRVIEAWLDDPTETTAALAAYCADLCLAVIRDITQPYNQATPRSSPLGEHC